MKIVMMHDLDTGFLAATLKPAFQALGHDCVVMQTVKTYLDENATHIDYLMGQMSNEDILVLKEEFKDTDLFILRSLTDTTLKLSGVLPYINKNNTIYRVHGSELRENGVPYTLRTWMIDWYGNEPTVVGPKDPSLLSKYRGNVITHIERPLNFDIMPKKRVRGRYALHTPTNIQRKGTQQLLDTFNEEGTIQLQIVSGVSREKILKLKAGASYFIDHLGSYPHGPYGMNSVECWYLKIPVWSNYTDMDTVMCPDLPKLVHKLNIDTLQKEITGYERDNKALNYAYKYAINIHSPITIASQYIALGKSISSI